MDILIRNKTGGQWIKVKEKKFQKERVLQNIIYTSPDIIPMEKLGGNFIKPRLFINEAGLPGSGNTDLIGIDENGGITIIECKLATNTDIRRKVIGQVFEYAAYLWQMSYDDFDAICSNAEKWNDTSLFTAMRNKMEKTGEEWSEETFEVNVTAMLNRGDFRLIIAVDELNDELKRIIQFINSRGDNTAKLYALELQQFESEELQLLVPEMFGTTLPLKREGMMDEHTFIAQSSPVCRQLFSQIRELTKKKEFSRSSFTRKGFAFRCESGNIFVLLPDNLMMWFGQDYSDNYLTRGILDEFWHGLFQISAPKAKQESKNPVVKVNDATWTQADVDQFIDVLKLLGSRINNKVI